MKKWLIALLVLGALYFALRDPDYPAFDAQREAWHRRCDAYVNVVVTERNKAQIATCQQELAELMAYAKRKGWD